MENRERTSEAQTGLSNISTTFWWLSLIQGIAAIVLGIFLLVWPVQTTLLLMRMIALYLIVSGLLELISVLNHNKAMSDRIWKFINSALFILGGLLIFAQPALSTLTVHWVLSQVLGFVALIGGFVGVIQALFKTGGGFRFLVAGVVALLIGGTLPVHSLLCCCGFTTVPGFFFSVRSSRSCMLLNSVSRLCPIEMLYLSLPIRYQRRIYRDKIH